MVTTQKETEKKTSFQKPLGQRVLDAGFTLTTRGRLRERFACEKMQKQVNDKIEKRFWKTVEEAKKNGFPIVHFAWKSDNVLDITLRRKGIMASMFPDVPERAIYICSERFKICDVGFTPLEEYVEDKIPERCYANIDRAKKLGLKDFEVAAPFIGDMPKADPVIVARLGNKWFEIDMWE